MKYRVLVFDFDGTIADTMEEARRIYNELAPDYGIREVGEHEIAELRHLSLKQILLKLEIPKRRVPSIIARGTGMMRGNIEKLQVIDGMKEALVEMRKQVDRFGILTSNATANVDVFLRNHGLRDLFEFVSSTSKLTGKARHLRAIRKTFSLHAEEMLYIGDELRDVKAAQKAGIPHAAVSWGFNSRESLEAARPTYLIDRPEDFLRLFSPASGG
ncbi:MAG: HAD hydrolase-like protein [Armatimonadetes bacterium]|nr:HAD hydrolase-like protein [Akkermansiaceae bacterium]